MYRYRAGAWIVRPRSQHARVPSSVPALLVAAPAAAGVLPALGQASAPASDVLMGTGRWCRYWCWGRCWHWGWVAWVPLLLLPLLLLPLLLLLPTAGWLALLPLLLLWVVLPLLLLNYGISRVVDACERIGDHSWQRGCGLQQTRTSPTDWPPARPRATPIRTHSQEPPQAPLMGSQKRCQL